MGTFFLIFGSLLFFAGLACLLIVFVGIARRLKASFSASAYFRGKRSRKTPILITVGIVSIILAQSLYWFADEVSRFSLFEETMPRAQISFVYEEDKRPRMLVETTSQNNVPTSQLIPFTADRVSVGVEVVRWNKLFRVLGLSDGYRINGIYSLATDADAEGSLGRIPDQEINGGPSSLVGLARVLGKMFPGKLQLYFSEPVLTDGHHVYTLEFSPDGIASSRTIDSRTALHYSN